MNPVIDHYRCTQCRRRVREATNTTSRQPSVRNLMCDTCDQVTLHQLIITNQETTTMTTTNDQALSNELALCIIATELRAEAKRRGWSDDYDLFVDRVNERAGNEVLQRIKPKARKYLLTIELESTTAPDTARIHRGLTDNIRRGTSVLPPGTKIGSVGLEARP